MVSEAGDVMKLFLIPFLVFIGSFLIMIAIVNSFQTKRGKIKKRLIWAQRGTQGNLIEEKEESLLNKFTNKFINNDWKWLRIWKDKLQQELKRANLPITAREFSLILLFFLVGGWLIGIILTKELLKGSFFAVIFSFFPLIWVRLQKEKRKQKIAKQIPDMLNILASSLKAGYSFLQALDLLAREIPPPLTEEVNRLLQETRLGVGVEDALINFNQRINSKDMDLVVTALLIQRQVGGNLAEILETIGSTIRERLRIQGEIRSLTAQGRLSAMIFILLPLGIAGFLF